MKRPAAKVDVTGIPAADRKIEAVDQHTPKLPLHQQHTVQETAKTFKHTDTLRPNCPIATHHDSSRSLWHLPLGVPGRCSLHNRGYRPTQLDLLHLSHRQRPHQCLIRLAQKMLEHYGPVYTFPPGPGLLRRQPFLLQYVEEYWVPDELHGVL